jgi:cytochrome c oxidase subunit II
LTRRRGPHARRPAVRLGLAALAVALLAGCAPEAITDTGQSVGNLYNVILVMGAVVFVGVEIAIVYNALRYRRRRDDDELPPQIHGNVPIEIVWTAIPSVIILAMFVISMVVLADVNRQTDDTELTVRVTGFQWQWQFDYLSGPQDNLQPLGVTVLPEGQEPPTLVLPVGERIHFDLMSVDVVHAFYVPDFLFKRDIIPGQENEFELEIQENKAGQTFEGQCAELCGDLHNAMTFRLEAMADDDFRAWLERTAQEQEGQAQCAPTGTELHVVAQAIQFDTTCLAAPAGQDFTILFDNRDPDQHNVAIYTTPEAAEPVFVGEIFPGPDTQTYEVPAIEETGDLFFRCDVHPGMNGTFVVK